MYVLFTVKESLVLVIFVFCTMIIIMMLLFFCSFFSENFIFVISVFIFIMIQDGIYVKRIELIIVVFVFKTDAKNTLRRFVNTNLFYIFAVFVIDVFMVCSVQKIIVDFRIKVKQLQIKIFVFVKFVVSVKNVKNILSEDKRQ